MARIWRRSRRVVKGSRYVVLCAKLWRSRCCVVLVAALQRLERSALLDLGERVSESERDEHVDDALRLCVLHGKRGNC